MCTSLSLTTDRHYFGRSLDLHMSYGEEVTVVPRHFPLRFRHTDESHSHYAMIGMAAQADGVPLFFDAVNEHGLGGAGLNFPTLAVYRDPEPTKHNIASFEVIPWVLSRCRNISEARKLLRSVNVTNDAFRHDLPPSPLHWMFSGADGSLILESVSQGVKIYDAPAGVLTNCPDFPSQSEKLSGYGHLLTPMRRTADNGDFGLSDPAAAALPGGVSSSDRFVRCAVYRALTPRNLSKNESLSQFFDILGTVSVPCGCCITHSGDYHHTRYISCCDTREIVYYHRRWGQSELYADSLFSAAPDGEKLFTVSR